jgi:hypothetical protein
MRTWTATTTTAAPGRGLSLAADGPVGFDVAYELAAVQGGSEVRASVSVRTSRGIAGRLLAEATSALLSAGALEAAVLRIAREAGVTSLAGHRVGFPVTGERNP